MSSLKVLGGRFKHPPLLLPHPLTIGLVAWWKVLPHHFGGGSWYDLVRGMVGQISAASWTLQGPPGGWGSLSFNGTSSYVSVPNSSQLQTGGKSFSVAVRFRTTTASCQPAGKSTWSGDGEWDLQIISGDIGLYTLNTAGQYQSAASSTAVNDGTWHLVVGVQDTANNRIGISLDGGTFLYSTISHTSSSTTDPLVMGQGSLSSGHFMAGSIDDVLFYNRVLSQANVGLLNSLAKLYYPGVLNPAAA